MKDFLLGDWDRCCQEPTTLPVTAIKGFFQQTNLNNTKYKEKLRFHMVKWYKLIVHSQTIHIFDS